MTVALLERFSMPFQIIAPGTHFDFVSRGRACAFASLFMILVSLVAVPIRGVRLGVDFAGGTLIQMKALSTEVDEGGVRAILARTNHSEATVTRLGERSDSRFQILIPQSTSKISEDPVSEIEKALSERFGTLEIEKVDSVGGRAGEDLRRSALLCMTLSLALILVYIAFRFSPAYAPGAVVALIHDVVITAGVFVVLAWEFDFKVIAALLTIIGYSLNDTIIIYDRIRENRGSRKVVNLAEIVNKSVNDTLSRTILTSGTTLLAVLALLAFGGPELRGFSAALLIGIVVGTYSSVYVASPLMVAIENVNWGKNRPAASGKRTAASRP